MVYSYYQWQQTPAYPPVLSLKTIDQCLRTSFALKQIHDKTEYTLKPNTKQYQFFAIVVQAWERLTFGSYLVA